jgi:hypothetical protein
MSAPLLDHSIVEQHAVIQFLWSERVKPSKIHRRMLAQYGENCITQGKVYQWVERFQSGSTSIIDEDCTGCPTTSQTADNIGQVNILVQKGKQITVNNITNKLDNSCISTHSIIKNLRYHKICKRWVPKQLTDDHIWAHMEICMQLLQWYHKGEAFLQWTIRSDEEQVHHYEPASKHTKHEVETHVTAQDQEI